MADRLYLSLWLKNPSALTVIPRYLALLREFPFSRLAPKLTLTVRAVSIREAPVFEDAYESIEAIETLEEAARAWTVTDASFEVEGAWDLLLKTDSEWKLSPSRVSLIAYGPEFEREQGEDLRIEFGQESPFIPVPESPESFRYVQDNIKSLLTLVRKVESGLPVAKRLLWSESGGNFAERLAAIARSS